MLCWLAVAAGAAPGVSALQVRDAWVRWLPAELPAAGYLTLVNSSDQPASLIAASSPDYAEVSLHRSRIVDGANQMEPVREIAVAAHASLAFATHGYHLMLLHPTRPLKPGDHVPVTLNFAGGAALTVQFELRSPDTGAGAAHMPDMPGMSH